MRTGLAESAPVTSVTTRTHRLSRDPAAVTVTGSSGSEALGVAFYDVETQLLCHD